MSCRPTAQDRTYGTDQSNDGRSPLRRFDSFASLQTLNPFRRRRSNNTTASTQAEDDCLFTPSSSTFSIASTAAKSSKPSSNHMMSSSPSRDTRHDSVTDVASPVSANPDRRGFTRLLHNPLESMPRSRTFSNLPIPTRLRKTSKPLSTSASHVRLPFTTAPARVEDCADFIYSREAHKENICSYAERSKSKLSFIDSRGSYGSKWSSQACATRHAWRPSGDMSEPLLRKPSADSQRTEFKPQHQQLQSSTAAQYSSSCDTRPTSYLGIKEQAQTLGQPVQRWRSQPLLTRTTNNAPLHREIRQTRLLSARQAPTPPLRTSMTSDVLSSSRIRSTSVVDRNAESCGTPTNSTRSTSPIRYHTNKISNAEDATYWTGRFSALTDRYCNEDLASHMQSSHQSSLPSRIVLPGHWMCKSEIDKTHSAEANIARMRRAVEHLHSLCASVEASESFSKWQAQLGAALEIPELSKPVKAPKVSYALGTNPSMGKENDPVLAGLFGGVDDASTSKKKGFLDRLLGGRAKRKSLTFD